VEYWDEDRCVYWANSEEVKVGKGRKKASAIPHSMAASRMPSTSPGRQAWPSGEEGAAHPRFHAQPIDRMDMLASQEATFVARYAGMRGSRSLMRWRARNADAEHKRTVDLRPGAVNYFRETEKFQPIYGGRLQPELQEAMARYRQEFERGHVPRHDVR